MMERDAAEAIFQKLCEKFKLDGEREWENAFTVGADLGFTEAEVQNALWIFATDGQHCVEIDGIRIGRVRLTLLGIESAASRRSSPGTIPDSRPSSVSVIDN